MTKAKIERSNQRARIDNSFYGFWTDREEAIEIKVTPHNSYTRIKIVAVNQLKAIERIAFYCGLSAIPRRQDWNGFDFITHLVKVSATSYVDGLVHMPYSTQRIFSQVVLSADSTMRMDFYFPMIIGELPKSRFTGSLWFHKRMLTIS